MPEVLFGIVNLGLLVFALIDAAQTPEDSVRNLGKGWWILLIILVPLAGPIAWLVAGRPLSTSTGPRNVPWPATRTAGFPEHERQRSAPDDDPEFLSTIKRDESQHEAMLKQWEADLRAREQQLRGEEKPGSSHPQDSETSENDQQK